MVELSVQRASKLSLDPHAARISIWEPLDPDALPVGGVHAARP
jgi:hypothetical protein